tara:strand:- start:1255 stop:1701 length:447 start_codon:yes stop_codon:yes gene_type:complete
MEIIHRKEFHLHSFKHTKHIEELVNDKDIDLINNRPWQCKNQIKDKLLLSGWENRIKISSEMNVSIQYKKSNVGLQFQFGNVAWGFYDLIKLQSAFDKEIIEYAVLVAAVKNVTNRWGSNIFHYERAEKEFEIYLESSKIPLLLLGVT